MTLKMETPARRGDATGANIEAADFSHQLYRVRDVAATAPFAPVGLSALRVLHLVHRYRVTADRAALLADLAFGEGRA